MRFSTTSSQEKVCGHSRDVRMASTQWRPNLSSGREHGTQEHIGLEPTACGAIWTGAATSTSNISQMQNPLSGCSAAKQMPRNLDSPSKGMLPSSVSPQMMMRYCAHFASISPRMPVQNSFPKTNLKRHK